ncbi:unnamed protein product [Debaryomyces fabryi]|nr:unnamed protein product [Debaryomyces fabryi]
MLVLGLPLPLSGDTPPSLLLASLIASGPKRAPGLNDTPVSNGAPTTAISIFSSNNLGSKQLKCLK